MEAIRAIKILQQRNVNYCIKRGDSDNYSRQTDEIISSFVDTYNLSVKRGNTIDRIVKLVNFSKDHPEVADMILYNIGEIIKEK